MNEPGAAEEGGDLGQGQGSARGRSCSSVQEPPVLPNSLYAEYREAALQGLS